MNSQLNIDLKAKTKQTFVLIQKRCNISSHPGSFMSCSAGGLGQNTFYVDYRTEDGSANAGSDYHYSEGTLVFKPGDTQKEIKVREEKLLFLHMDLLGLGERSKQRPLGSHAYMQTAFQAGMWQRDDIKED